MNFQLITPHVSVPHIHVTQLGHSEQGRELLAYKVGNGPLKVSLIAGCHSDEPQGPHTLRHLLKTFSEQPDHPWLQRGTFFIQPHMNPDGEARNQSWIESYPNLEMFRKNGFREAPGRDVEFGFPDQRVENSTWSTWIREHGPMDLHLSLHGMALSEGALLLIERHWTERTNMIQERYRQRAQSLNLGLHDHDRKGSKGFLYYGPGFASTPEGQAMQKHFVDNGDPDMAQKFKLSSMEFIRSLGGDPLCMVTELPLWLIQNPSLSQPGQPLTYLKFRQAYQRGDAQELSDLIQTHQLKPLDISDAMNLQLEVIDWGMETLEMV